MEILDIVFMLLLVVLAIIQAVMLVKGIKRKNIGFDAVAVDFLSIVIAVCMMLYYEALPGYGFFPGLTYIIQELVCLVSLALYTLIMFITVCSKITVFERRRKSECKSHAKPIVLSLAFICLVGAAAVFAYEKYENRDISSATGTVTSFEEHDMTYYTDGEMKEITYDCPVITFSVDGNEYSDYVYPDAFEEKVVLGDSVKIYIVPSYSTGYYITTPDDARLAYIPAFALGLLLLIYRVLKPNKSKGNAEIQEPTEDSAENADSADNE